MDSKTKAIYTHYLMYYICIDIDKRTPKVDNWMRQVRLGLINKNNKEFISEMESKVHELWREARQKVIEKDSKLNVKMSELLMAMYNRIEPNYQNLYYTDKTFTGVVNSFNSHYTKLAEEDIYTHDAWKLADAWLKEIGVETRNLKLATRRKVLEQNRILEGKL